MWSTPFPRSCWPCTSNGGRRPVRGLPELPTARVEALHAAAQGVAATSMLLAVDHDLSARNSRVAGLAGAAGISDSAAHDYPSLRTLFGDLDYCECRDCQSVL